MCLLDYEMMYGRDESAPTPYGVFVDIYFAQVVSEKVCKPIFFLSLYLETLK